MAKTVLEPPRRRTIPTLPATPPVIPPVDTARATGVVERTEADRDSLAARGEEILFRWARGGERTANEERILLQLFGDPTAIQIQLARATRVLARWAECPGPAELERRREAAIAAQEKADREMPEIERQIVELGTRKEAIEAAVIKTVAAHDRAHEVRKQQIMECPPDDRRNAEMRSSMIGSRYREALDLEMEVAWRRDVRGIIGVKNRTLHLTSRRINKDETLLPQADDHGNFRDADWQNYARRREQEADAMELRLIELKGLRDTELAELQALLERYWIAAPP